MPFAVKVYLDNNIVSAIAKDDSPSESDALDRLLKAMDEGKVQLVTSEVARSEIEAYQDKVKHRLNLPFFCAVNPQMGALV